MTKGKATHCGTMTITEEGKAPRVIAVTAATFGVTKIRDEFRWEFEAKGEDYEARAEAKHTAQTGDPAMLFKTPIAIPLGYCKETQIFVATFYYYEHEDMDENVIACVRQDSGRYELRWTGRSWGMGVEIVATFQFEGLKELPLRTQKILFINKSQHVALDLRDLLDGFGYETIAVNDISSAVNAFHQHPEKNLIITMWLSSEEVQELVKEVRSNGFKGKTIVITTTLPPQDRSRLEALSIDKILEVTTGLDSRLLLKTVEEI